MIQNKYLESGLGSKVLNIVENIKKGCSLKNIIFVILSLVLSGVAFMGDYLPFSFLLFGVASVFNVPLILVLIFSTIGLTVTSISTIMIIKLLAFFAVFTLITALINIEGISRRVSVFIKFMSSITIIEVVFNIVQGTMLANFFGIGSNLLVMATLYFVFTAGIYVLVNVSKGYVYSKEESVAMVTVLALASTVLINFNILGFSIFNIVTLVLILVYGWKSGAISGAAAGLIVGLFLTGIANVSMTYVVILSFSGAIAGILSKFGKVSVIIGFVIGNIYISYYANGFSELTMHISEVLIASVSLLFIPKSIEAKLSKLFNKNITLAKPYENILDVASDVKSRIGAVSEVFDSLSGIAIETTPESSKETREVIKKYIQEFIYNSCIDCKTRKDCLNQDDLGLTVDYIALKLENNEKLDKDILKFNCDSSDKIITNIYEIYNSMKLMRILKQKEKENSIKLSNQYKEVSKILSGIAKNIKNEPMIQDKTREKLRDELKFYGFIVYEDEYLNESGNIEYTFVTDILNNIDKQKKQIVKLASDILEQNMTIKLILNSSKKEKSKIRIVSTPNFEVQTSIAAQIKDGETISGDSYISMELEDLKSLTVLSDGAGSGKEASKGSSTVISMLEKLLSGGFTEEKSIDIINSILKLKGDETTFSTLDASIINLKTAEAQFIKIGAAPTYLVEKGKIITINTQSLPIGLVNDTDYLPICKTLENDTFVIQLTDGVVPEDMDINNNYITNYLQNLDITKSSRCISDDLHKLVLRENKSGLKDDMTIIVTKFKKS